MSHSVIGAFAVAALIAAGSAFAADAPPAASSAPAAATAAAPTAPVVPATPPTPAPTAAAAPVAAAPAPAPVPMAAPAPMEAMPAKIEKPRVSACTRAIRSAEHDLKVSKAKPEAIAGAWQHIQAAKQARTMHKKDACKSEAAAASKMSSMM
ncbi:hypothetical protein [Paramagnetospirillum kuznetsovii]|uniref:hypothetical protein n=1 Tax=Paramagnetospirillum kuznetsovii TaxID=2053833 RepID=UPI00137529E8|nr:hypothetical protein [Paramagnetospirillum kuznetsovii]